MPERRQRRTHIGEVRSTEWLTPHMVRVTLGGPGLSEFSDNSFTDKYAKLVFPRSGVEYPEPFDVSAIRESMSRDQWPITRTYTVRRYDAQSGEIVIDFVSHGDEGYAGPWAANAKPGDTLHLMGPGGAYTPDPAADWHLLIGDESAIPAISSAVEELPAGSRARVYVEVADASERQELRSPADLDITWLHRSDGDDLGKTVLEATFPEGDVHAFVHGEAGFVFALRRHLRDERNIPRERLSISGYWRRGKDEDGWQAEKAEIVKAEQAS